MIPLNPHVRAVLEELPRAGGYNWPASGDGCTADVRHRGVTILRAGRGTYCCGLTLEILFRAYARAGCTLPLTIAEARELRARWFVAREGLRRGPLDALPYFGLGIDASTDPQPGDFAQLWRPPDGRGRVSGHSVVVLDYDGKRLRYLSTQNSTKGIGERSERVDPSRLHVARAMLPERTP